MASVKSTKKKKKKRLRSKLPFLEGSRLFDVLLALLGALPFFHLVLRHQTNTKKDEGKKWNMSKFCSAFTGLRLGMSQKHANRHKPVVAELKTRSSNSFFASSARPLYLACQRKTNSTHPK